MGMIGVVASVAEEVHRITGFSPYAVASEVPEMPGFTWVEWPRVARSFDLSPSAPLLPRTQQHRVYWDLCVHGTDLRQPRPEIRLLVTRPNVHIGLYRLSKGAEPRFWWYFDGTVVVEATRTIRMTQHAI